MENLEEIFAERKDDNYPSREDLIKYNTTPGLILEFGIAQGHSFNAMCEAAGDRKCYGFDWFNGLPENWKSDGDAGTFSNAGMIPAPPPNGEYVVGLVQYTLVPFLEKHPEPVTYVCFDLDLYAGTKFALAALAHRFHTGTILVFDEITHDPIHIEHEQRAFLEFLKETGFWFEYVSSLNHEDARAVSLIKKA